MINQESLAAVESARFSAQFMRPIYTGYSFAQIPQTIRYCLTDTDQKGVPFGTPFFVFTSRPLGTAS